MAILNELLEQTQTAAVEQATSTALGKTTDAAGNVVLGPDTALMLDYLNQFRMELDTANALISQLQTLLNGKASAASLSSLAQRVGAAETTLLSKAEVTYVNQQVQAIGDIDAGQASAIAAAQQALSTENGVLQGILTKLGTYDVLLPQLRTDVDSKAQAATVSALTGQVTTLRNTVGDAASGLAATYALAANALPLAGGTMTGALNVLVPATASNPLQYSSLPLSMTVQQALPLIALGGTYSFTVAVANAVVGQVVVLNMQASLLASVSYYAAAVSAAGTVTVTLKAGLQIAAGTQTFYLRVLR